MMNVKVGRLKAEVGDGYMAIATVNEGAASLQYVRGYGATEAEALADLSADVDEMADAFGGLHEVLGAVLESHRLSPRTT